MVDFRIRVVVDPTAAKSGSKAVKSELDRTTASADKLRGTLLKALSLLGGGLLISRGIQLLADYGQAMSTVQGVTNATSAEFERLTEKAQQLGISTRFSAVQAAEGMVYLARSGLNVDEVLGSIGDTLRLAQAGALDLGLASKITAEIMRSFRLDASQASRIVDVFTTTANSANTNVEQLGGGMKYVGAIATGLGVSLEETTAAMAALSDAGLQSTMAGTGLRRILAELESPTKRSQKILSRFGLTADQVKVSEVGLTQALRALAEAGIDTGTGLQIFGQRGGPAFEVLSNAIPKIVALNEKLKNSEGTAKRVADIMDRNLKGALFSLRSAYEGLVLKIGKAGEESSSMTKVVRLLTGSLRSLADHADVVASSVEALILLMGARGLMRVLSLVRAAILTNPLGILTKGLLLGAALLIAFRDQLKLSSDGMATLGDAISVTIELIGELGDALIIGLGPTFSTVSDSAQGAFGEVDFSIKGVLTLAAKASDSIAGFFAGSFAAIVATWDQLDENFDGIFQLVLKAARDSAESIIDFFLSGFQTLGDVITRMWGNISNAIAAGSGGLGALSKGNYDAAADQADSAKNALALAGNEFKLFPKYLEENRKKLASVEFLPEVELTNQAKDVATTIAEAFTSNFQQTTGAQDVLKGIFEESERRAVARAEQLAAAKAKDAEASKEATAAQQALNLELGKFTELSELEQELLSDIQQDTDGFSEAQAALNNLLGMSAITVEEYNKKLDELRAKALSADTSISGGFSSGLLKIRQEMEDVGSVMEDTLVNAFGNAEDALVNFVRTGQLNFEDFVNSLLDDIARLLVRLLVLESVKAIAGGATGGLSSVLFGLAGGGTARANEPYVVGEDGPELFVPGKTGTVLPNAATEAALASGGTAGGTTVIQAPAPEVKVNITNVSDPSEIPAAMNSPAGDQTILNSVSRNKEQFKRMLQ